jgi:hypothetical protein
VAVNCTVEVGVGISQPGYEPPPLELEELDELDELELDVLDEELELELELDDEPAGPEHSFTPPLTLLPAPNVASEHTKLPLKTRYVNLSARPNATFVFAATEQVLPSLQSVV